MINEQGSHINPGEFSRCEERDRLQEKNGNDHSPTRRMDVALEEEIMHAIWQDNVLRATDSHEIDIHVEDGIVYLSGHLLSSINYQRVKKALQTTSKEMRGSKSSLVMDDDLLLEVAASLGPLEQLHHCKFFTGVSHGVVVLNGDVSSTNIRLSAELCAASHPNVRGVINYIRVPGIDLGLQDHRLLQPSIGKEICFRDGVSGIVKQVVINPDNRRVIAMTIRGRFYDAQQNISTATNGPIRAAEQTLVIPMNVVEHLTDSSGFLTIQSSDFAKMQKFNASLFSAPPTDWTPPYPYCPADVLFSIESQPVNAISESVPERVSATLKVEERVLSAQLLANDSLGG